MGMFDESYVNLPQMEQASGFGDTNAFMIGAQSGTQGMFQGLGKLMGFQDEEDLLMEIYNSSDLTTPQGRKEAIDRVRQVNPEAAEKLQQQILNGAEAEAAIQNTEMNVETKKLERAALLFGPAIKRKFETDVSVNGKRAAVQAFLINEGIEFKSKDINTQLDAIKLINKKYGKGGSIYLTGLKDYVSAREEAYVRQGVQEQAGLSYQGSDDSTTASNIDLPDLTDTGTTSTATPKYAEAKINSNDSNFTKAYKENKATNEIKQKLQDVKQSLFNIGIESFMPQDKLARENAEDAVSEWIAGPAFGSGEITGLESSALQWFLSQSPEELDKFISNPVAYYKKNRSKIESSTTYASDLDNNEDLFASIPY